METAVLDDERRNRLLSTNRAQIGNHEEMFGSAREVPKSCWHPDQEPLGDARHRHLIGAGPTQMRGCKSFCDFARSEAAANSRAKNFGAFGAPGRRFAIARGRNSRRGYGGADHSGN